MNFKNKFNQKLVIDTFLPELIVDALKEVEFTCDGCFGINQYDIAVKKINTKVFRLTVDKKLSMQ